MSSFKDIIKNNKEKNRIEIDENVEKEFTKKATGENRITNPKGRPKIENETEKRNKNIMLYLTENEKNILADRAKKAGLSVSSYILIKSLKED